MRMHIHEPDFAAEERRRFRAPENPFGPPMIGDRLLHEARAIGIKEMLSDEAEMAPRLALREDSPDDPLCHGNEREGEAGVRIAWMKHELRQAAFGCEYAVACDDAVTNQKAVEVPAHGRGERVEFLRLFEGAPGVTKDCGVSAKLLVEKRDSPTAHHPVALCRVDRLKRVVPVAVPIADQVRARDETL